MQAAEDAGIKARRDVKARRGVGIKARRQRLWATAKKQRTGHGKTTTQGGESEPVNPVPTKPRGRGKSKGGEDSDGSSVGCKWDFLSSSEGGGEGPLAISD